MTKGSACIVDDCDREATGARGWCKRHYCRWRRHGDPLQGKDWVVGSQEEQFWSKVAQDGDCWIWTRGKYPGGYGFFHVAGKGVRAHRWAYESLRGEIPEGLELDHLCRNPPCVNPWHLEPVTGRVNKLRSESPAAKHARQTHCHRGHDLTERSSYSIRKGPNGRVQRRCKLCARAWRPPSDRPIKHGTDYAYGRHECRCLLCRHGHAERARIAKKRRVEAAAGSAP